MKHIELQAHKGVASECPENTMTAFRCAVIQGYDVIELDLQYTSDKRIVVMHDRLINRTARKKDGSPIDKEKDISEITYDEALQYDFGTAVSNKYRKEKLPLFKEVLELSAQTGIRLKIDNKIQSFPKEILSILFSMITDYAENISVTSNDVEFVKKCLNEIPELSIDYDGAVTEDILRTLHGIIPKDCLTVWLPYECGNTSWVKIPFADEKTAKLVKEYARLGIWLLSDYDSFYDAAKRLKPDIVETDGAIKPKINVNRRYDMHTHSKNSHDSECDVFDMRAAAYGNGLAGFAVTDHCDIEYYETVDLDGLIKSSAADAKAADNESDMTVLRGTEIGEGFWHRNVTEGIIEKFDFDVIIGSVHAVQFKDYDMPYSQIDFSKMGAEKLQKYLDKYFDDMISMIEACDFDILAHLTCPLRYINGKYHMNADCKKYKDKIERILRYIIDRKIALEINTSCVYDGSGYCELMPEEWIIQMYKDMGGYLITTGSDAHIAKNSANSFDMLYKKLKEMGFKNTYYYKNRFAVQCAID